MKRLITTACFGFLASAGLMLGLAATAHAQGGLLEGMHLVNISANSPQTLSADPRLVSLAAKHDHSSNAVHTITIKNSNGVPLSTVSLRIDGTYPSSFINTYVNGFPVGGCNWPTANFGTNYNISLHARATDPTAMNYEFRTVVQDPYVPTSPYNCVTNVSLNAAAASAEISFSGSGAVGWYRHTDYLSQSFYNNGYDPVSYRSGTLHPGFYNLSSGAVVPGGEYQLVVSITNQIWGIPLGSYVFYGNDVLDAMDALNNYCEMIAGSKCYIQDTELSVPGGLSYIVQHSGLMSETYGIFFDFSRVISY